MNYLYLTHLVFLEQVSTLLKAKIYYKQSYVRTVSNSSFALHLSEHLCDRIAFLFISCTCLKVEVFHLIDRSFSFEKIKAFYNRAKHPSF